MPDNGMNDERKDLSALRYSSFNKIIEKFNSIVEKYGDMPAESLYHAFNGLGMNPYIQNSRVKSVSTLPESYSKNKVAEMIRKPDSHEKQLRGAAHALEYTAYPMFHTRKIYQELLTYHSYITPCFCDETDVKEPEFWREYKLLEKLRRAFDLKSAIHQITGQALVEGKVFYTPRFSVDKSHNKVNYAFLQQLPSDWVKIVGLNNRSKYTVAFDMMYFMQAGTDYRQFGDLFAPYIDNFATVVKPSKSGKIINAAKCKVDIMKMKDLEKEGKLLEKPEAYSINNRWFYWVTLPADRVFTFEIDDVNRNVFSPFTGLFIDMIQLGQYEAIQLELLQNPLVSILTGEIPLRDDKNGSKDDDMKISNGGRLLYQMLWNEMLAQYNTSGIGLYAAPFANMKLHSLSEAPSAMDIVSKGYEDTISKAGLAGIVPTSSETRAGLAQISLELEGKFAEEIYSCANRMMNCIIESISPIYSWQFKMFGTVDSDNKDEERLRSEMTLGILPSTLRYLAIRDLSIFDDFSISSAIKEMGLLDFRIPLVSTYSAKQENSGLPPQAKHDLNPGGRPESKDITSEGTEGHRDSPAE